MDDSETVRQFFIKDPTRRLKNAPLENFIVSNTSKRIFRAYLQEKGSPPILTMMLACSKMLLEVKMTALPTGDGGFLVGMQIMDEHIPKIYLTLKNAAVIQLSLDRLENDVYSAIQSDRLMYSPVGPTAYLDAVLMMLPTNLQAEFIVCYLEHNVSACSHLLEYTISARHGCGNLLFGNPKNMHADSILDVWGLFISMASQFVDQPETAFTVFAMLDNCLLHKLPEVLDSGSLALAFLQFNLAMFSAGRKFPHEFPVRDLTWMRTKFLDSLLRMPILFDLYGEKLRCIPLLHFMCVSWAKFMIEIGHPEEANALLRIVQVDIANFAQLTASYLDSRLGAAAAKLLQ